MAFPAAKTWKEGSAVVSCGHCFFVIPSGSNYLGVKIKPRSLVYKDNFVMRKRNIIRDSYLFEVILDLLSLRVGVFQMELLGLYWHIWSKLTIISSENLTEDWKFGKRSI